MADSREFFAILRADGLFMGPGKPREAVDVLGCAVWYTSRSAARVGALRAGLPAGWSVFFVPEGAECLHMPAPAVAGR